ncbi:MAG: ZIP family metal transporter [Planctomycetes bacterium]|nr:ZIP family metal transporter [Planctomycetota bacterium]
MDNLALIAIYCFLIVLASLIGGWIPLLIKLTHQRLELAISFVSGAMLGVALLHLLPHAWSERAQWMDATNSGSPLTSEAFVPITIWVLAGFLAMFLLERFFCFHHHEAEDKSGCDHDHGHTLTWAGAALGLTLHSLIAGIALGASVVAEKHGHDKAAFAGFGTFLMILLHKPFDSLTLGTLMAAQKRSLRLRHVINGSFGLIVPLGVVLFFLGMGEESPAQQLLISQALAFSAGTFLCIALSDLLPELQFHQHDRVKLTVALLLGLALAWGVSKLEARSHDQIPQLTTTHGN